MLMHKRVWYCLFLVSAVSILGCGQKCPDNFPDIFPCVIRLTQENQPLEGATVVLNSSSPELNRWAVSGISDAEGSVVLKTNGKYIGAPEGEFTVTVTKEEIIYKGGEKIVDGEKIQAKPEKFSLVEQIYNQPETSSLKVKIEKKKNQIELNVGKKVRIPVAIIQ